jgi:hypothetical protein
VISNRRSIMAELDAKRRRQAEACGIAGVNAMRARNPVDTGRSRAGKTYEVSGSNGDYSVRMGGSVDYDIFLEMSPATAHIVPGFVASYGTFKAIMGS